MAGASVAGAGHRRTGRPCEDAHAWAVLSGGRLVAAVADGAGSAPLGIVGAHAASRAAVDALRLRGDPDAALRHAVRAAATAVERSAQARGVQPGDLATTLLALVAGPEWVASIRVGDGAAVVHDAVGNLALLGGGGTNEYLNETVFLTSPGSLEDLQPAIWEGRASALALFTDGLEGLAIRRSDGAPHPPFFGPLFRFLAEEPDAGRAAERLQAFLEGPRVTERAEDDLTLLLAVRP